MLLSAAYQPIAHTFLCRLGSISPLPLRQLHVVHFLPKGDGQAQEDSKSPQVRSLLGCAIGKQVLTVHTFKSWCSCRCLCLFVHQVCHCCKDRFEIFCPGSLYSANRRASFASRQTA